MKEWFGTWIHVSKRIPQSDGDYLVWFNFTDPREVDCSHADVSVFKNGKFPESMSGAVISHWMPLPQPPVDSLLGRKQ